MKKILILIVLLIPTLAGCGKETPEDQAQQSQFSINFDSIDKEKKTAVFTVNGYPNEDEFAQVETVIIDSMKNQKVEGNYTVSVYSKVQDGEGDPTYGTVIYNDGEITENNLENITVEEYTAILEQ